MTTEAPGSPKRRHILSSFNPETEASRPERRPRSQSSATSPTKARTAEAHGEGKEQFDDGDPDDATRPRRSRLKLKDHRSSRRRRRRHRHRSRSGSRDRDSENNNKRDDQDDDNRHSSRYHHHHHHRSRHHRHGRQRTASPDPFADPPLDPEAAFRESLFDAMADDEGADYWAAVYGQPVHVYSNERVGPQGELERMTDEEYAAHVRQKMWEKTHAGLLEERARREEARRRKEEEQKTQRRLQRDMEDSLRRGEERRQRRQYRDQWEEYEKAWAAWDGRPETLAWPVEGGRGQRSITEENVKPFFVHGLRLEEVGEKTFVARLKEERVRWHPDKIQQRAGGTVDEDTLRDVTAVFQIIDKIWGEVRPRDG